MVTAKRYREWTLYPNSRKGSMLLVARLKDMTKAPDAGYASVYMFDEVAAQEILETKSSTGLDRFPVYSDMLMIDLDDGARQLQKAELALYERGLGYQVWNSGSKGFHIGIPLVEEVSGMHVPYSQRKWVEALDIGADLSLYQAGRILSLPGRLHPKTGRKKAWVKTIAGDKLSVPMLEPAAPSFAFTETEGDLSAGLWQLMNMIQNEPGPGNRHTKIWSCAKTLAEAGLEFDTALDLLTQVNNKWQDSKEDEEVRAAVTQAYQR